MARHVVYHQSCADGFGCCWAAQPCQGWPARYGDDIPTGIPDWQDVMICDITFPLEQIKELQERSSSLMIIDHHEVKYPAEVSHVIDPDHAACVLTWKHLRFARQVPKLLRYIEDRDLWRWQMPFSREINAALHSYPQTVEAWNDIQFHTLKHDGRAILREQERHLEKAIGNSRTIMLHGLPVTIVNATYLPSEIGERFDRCLTYQIVDATIRLSFRSKDGSAIVLARRFGGGGHPNAAGATIPLSRIGEITLSRIGEIT